MSMTLVKLVKRDNKTKLEHLYSRYSTEYYTLLCYFVCPVLDRLKFV